jgi:1-deoxy-D-xylulose-5-phosphate reductoisomerase
VKAISVLGSTGSIGTQTLEIVEEFPDRFKVVALTAGNNLDLLVEQILRHAPEVVALADAGRLGELATRLDDLEPSRRPARLPELLGGSDGLCAAAAWASADLVVTGIVGCAGLLPTLSAIRAGKDLALANKETLIAAGPVVLPELQRSGSRLLPADSEHSALFQCLQSTYPPRGCGGSSSPPPAAPSATGPPPIWPRPPWPMPPATPTGAWGARSRWIRPP